ncbi:hypothetical protein [Clostridium hydrogenum]|uniref:hypothetical protein n=1 Tax=Clostridium hydrogenum TaxID=2855764 RepID=UPI001F428223|nr:hypothetical protein [Clostridium hydrogenum]
MLNEKSNFINVSCCKKMHKNIGKLSNKEIISLISEIEKDINRGIIIEDDIFWVIINTINNRLEDVETFYEYKKLKIGIEKLQWLKKKNTIYEYNKKEENLYNRIVESSPSIKNILIKLLDLESEREEKVMEYLKESSVRYR